MHNGGVMGIVARILVAFLVAGAIGCQRAEVIERRSSGAEGNPVPPIADVTGQWYGKAKPTNPADKEDARLAALTAGAQLELILDKDGRFKMTMMGTPMEGSYEAESEAVTLKIETVMGQRIDDPNAPAAFMLQELKEPIEGTIEGEGKTLFFPGKKDKPGEADMTFTRDKPAQDKVGPRTVAAAEAPLVGEYVFDDSYAPPKKPRTGKETPREIAREKAQEFSRNMSKGMRLTLREDNTFQVELMVLMKGSWKRSKGELILTIKEPKEMLAYSGGEKPEMRARIAPDGRLLMLNDKSGQVDFALKRR